MPKQQNGQEELAGAVRADLARHVGRRLGNPDNIRRLQALPQFSVERDLPDRLRELLGALDQAEERAS